MASLDNNQNNVFGGVQFEGNNEVENTSYFEMKTNSVFGGINIQDNSAKEKENVNKTFSFESVGQDKAIVKVGMWTKIKSFLFQEIDLNAPIKIELTPYQQKVEKEINDFLHQEVSLKGFFNLFKSKK